jgi:NAD(P)-dependent dehydrogenase (short-subunit alcohol dehydrogenase family)
MSPRKSSRHRVALVTGSSRGIGLAIAKALAGAGCNLVISGRDERSLQKATREVARRGGRVLTLPCDVTDAASVEALCAAAKRAFGRVDILVNNAGIAHSIVNVEQFDVEQWERVIATNLTGTFLVTRAALPLMPRGSIIVNMLSMAARNVFPGQAAYCASKYGALGFSEALREELRPRGIRVLAMLPGATSTDIWKKLWPDAPRNKMLSVDTVAKAVLDAVTVPENTSVDEVRIQGAAGPM